MKRRFILTRENQPQRGFSNVVIRDTTELVAAIINGRETRVYKPVSEVMNYLDAYPIMKKMNEKGN